MITPVVKLITGVLLLDQPNAGNLRVLVNGTRLADTGKIT